MKSLFYIFAGFLHILEMRAIDVATHIPPEIMNLNLSPDLINNTRRIINGEQVTDNRPYMVYLKLPQSNQKSQSYRQWLCGGVIVHEEYILTSAACIEDVGHFYIVSGTYKYADEDDRYNNPCIKNGAKKAIWKCVPKNYVFDGHENDNIRWMNNDIAVVKIEDGFDFARRVRGCEFVPKPVCYNNQSHTLENPGTVATIAGWGTTAKYNDWVNRRAGGAGDNSQCLLETNVEIIPKNRCKRRWGSRYHNIIDNYMICTKDIGQTMSEICNEKYVDCQDINYSDEEDMRRDTQIVKTEKVPTNLVLHSALHNETYANGSRRYQGNQIDGGFCEHSKYGNQNVEFMVWDNPDESHLTLANTRQRKSHSGIITYKVKKNDHGGPLVYGSGVSSVVIGIISACLVKERSNKCYGPFLYTSIYKNRQFISCAIYKDVEPKCRRQFRSGVTHVETVLSWKGHEDGPAKFELTQEQSAAVAAPAAAAAPPPQVPAQGEAAQGEAAQSDAVVAAPTAVGVEAAGAEAAAPAQMQVVQRAQDDVGASDRVYGGFVLRPVNETILPSNATIPQAPLQAAN